MTNTEEQEIKFIPDSEADVDAFGVHTQTATALSSIIATNINNTLRTIGLLGDWGSGKSTVIKFTQERLQKEQKDKFFFFTFDAWLHQGDAPRRSFLESIINKGCSEGLLDKKNYDEVKQKIQGRHEDHVIKTTPIFTGWAMLIALSLLFIPLAARMYNSNCPFFSSQNLPSILITCVPVFVTILMYCAWRDWNSFKRVTQKFFLLFSLSALTFLIAIIPANSIMAVIQEYPLLIDIQFWGQLIFFPLFAWAIYEFYKCNEIFFTKHKYKDRSITELFINKSVSHVTNKIVKTPDPTSIEFSNIFQNVIADLGKKGRILVVIFDNLDRVEKNLALNMWAMIRSLLICNMVPSNENNANYAKPFVIIPLDQTSIDLLYNTKPEGDNERSDSFADKTFDVVLQLSPPIFSDWESYLKEKLEYVFGESIQPKDVVAISRFFRLAHEEKGDYLTKITPRKLNSILNKAAAKKLLWKDAIPIGTICYYILFEKMLGELLLDINQDPPHKRILAASDADWLSNIASLHYGVEKEKAMQILIEPQIVAAITEGDEEAFNTVAGTPGFISVIEKFIEKNETIKTDARYILTLSSFMSLLKLNPTEECQKMAMVPQLYDMFCESGKWVHDEKSLRGVRLFLDDGSGTIAGILFHMSISLEEGVKNWANNFKSLINNLTNDGEIEQVKKELLVPGEADQFIEILYEMMGGGFSNANESLLQYFRPRAESAKVVESFLTFAEKKDRYDEDSLWMLRLLRDIQDKKEPKKTLIPLDIVFENIVNLLNQSASGNLANANWAVKALVTICCKNSKRSRTILSDSSIFNLYYYLHEDQKPASRESCYAIILLLMCFNSSMSGSAGTSGLNLIQNDCVDDTFIDSFVQFIQPVMEKAGHRDIFWHLIQGDPSNKVWDKLVTRLVAYKIQNYGHLGDNYVNLFTDYLDRVLFYANEDEVLTKIIEVIAKQDYFYKNVSKIADDKTAFDVFQLLDKHEVTQKTADAFYNYVSPKDKDWWDTVFNAPGGPHPVLHLLAAFQERLAGEVFGNDFSNSLQSYLDVFKGVELIDMPSGIEEEDWMSILHYLGEDKRTVFLKNTNDVIYNQATKPRNSNSLLGLYLESIQGIQEITQDHDRLGRLVLNILQTSDMAATEFHIVRQPDLYKDMMNGAEEATQKEISRALADLYKQSTENNVRTHLEAALITLEIPLPPSSQGLTAEEIAMD